MLFLESPCHEGMQPACGAVRIWHADDCTLSINSTCTYSCFASVATTPVVALAWVRPALCGDTLCTFAHCIALGAGVCFSRAFKHTCAFNHTFLLETCFLDPASSWQWGG